MGSFRRSSFHTPRAARGWVGWGESILLFIALMLYKLPRGFPSSIGSSCRDDICDDQRIVRDFDGYVFLSPSEIAVKAKPLAESSFNGQK